MQLYYLYKLYRFGNILEFWSIFQNFGIFQINLLEIWTFFGTFWNFGILEFILFSTFLRLLCMLYFFLP